MTQSSFRTLVVANPMSANGTLGRDWKRHEAVIRRAFGAFAHRMTRSPGDAADLAREAAEEGYEMVVAMGGDGTISEVTDGLFSQDGPVAPDVVLGVLPFGTGGDFRKSIGAPKDLASGARSLAGRETRSVDVARLTYTDPAGRQRIRHYINIASFGIGGLVDELVNHTTKALGGRLSFHDDHDRDHDRPCLEVRK